MNIVEQGDGLGCAQRAVVPGLRVFIVKMASRSHPHAEQEQRGEQRDYS